MATKRFPDGAHFRVEIAGVERASTLEALLEESARRKTPVHRVIATVGGSTFCDFQELQQMAKMAHDEKIEVIMTVGPRKSWDPGSKELSNPEGLMQGFRLRGSDPQQNAGERGHSQGDVTAGYLSHPLGRLSGYHDGFRVLCCIQKADSLSCLDDRHDFRYRSGTARSRR
jgi:hypothetical protein